MIAGWGGTEKPLFTNVIFVVVLLRLGLDM